MTCYELVIDFFGFRKFCGLDEQVPEIPLCVRGIRIQLESSLEFDDGVVLLVLSRENTRQLQMQAGIIGAFGGEVTKQRFGLRDAT